MFINKWNSSPNNVDVIILNFHGYNSGMTFEQEHIDEYTCICGDKYCEYTSPYEHYAKGDLTGDGKVNAVDANMISNYIIGHVAYEIQMEDAGDLNGDGKVGVIDINMLMKK